MFGYIRPFKVQLKICDYEIYQNIYAELRKSIKKQYGFFAPVLLDYDFVFLAFFESVFKEPEQVNSKLTAKEKNKISKIKKYEFSSAATVIFKRLYLEKKGIRKITHKLTKKAYEKAILKYPAFIDIVLEKLKVQEQLAMENCKSIDRASEPFSQMIGETLAYLLSESITNGNAEKTKENENIVVAEKITANERTANSLRKTGFYLGRFIYIMDALDNALADYEKGGFNPLVIGNPVINELDFDVIVENAEHSINFTLAALAEAYTRLEFTQYNPIVENIINMGLRQSFLELVEQKKEYLSALE